MQSRVKMIQSHPSSTLSSHLGTPCDLAQAGKEGDAPGEYSTGGVAQGSFYLSSVNSKFCFCPMYDYSFKFYALKIKTSLSPIFHRQVFFRSQLAPLVEKFSAKSFTNQLARPDARRKILFTLGVTFFICLSVCLCVCMSVILHTRGRNSCPIFMKFEPLTLKINR